MKDNWLKDLQGKLADYEREAPDMLWENIEKQLQSPRHKRNAHVWTWKKYVQLPFFYFSYAPHIF